MASNHPKRSIVIDFSAEDARLLVYPVEREKTQSIIADALEIPILFDEAAAQVATDASLTMSSRVGWALRC